MKFVGLTYKYHADVMRHYPSFTYEQFTNPYLVVFGSDDLSFDSINCFIENSMKVDNYVTCICLAGVGHNLKQNSQALERTFSFFKNQIILYQLIKEPTSFNSDDEEDISENKISLPL